ncbi:hypothetical protein BDY24DRAFT_370443 [Mrakia frigida]|uniref:uncharacterized protein n=1 Tax=Mrakia frigida TaxID=29902 RepID=UPI003FCC26CA
MSNPTKTKTTVLSGGCSRRDSTSFQVAHELLGSQRVASSVRVQHQGANSTSSLTQQQGEPRSMCSFSVCRPALFRFANEIFYINVKYNPKATDLADKFSVYEVHNLPFHDAAMLFSQSMAGFDAPGILAGMKKAHLPVSVYNRLLLGILRSEHHLSSPTRRSSLLLLSLLRSSPADKSSPSLLASSTPISTDSSPDIKWKDNFTARIKRKERYLDPTLVPAGSKVEIEPLFAEQDDV